MDDDLWNKAVKVLTDHAIQFVIMVVIFAVIAVVVGLIIYGMIWFAASVSGAAGTVIGLLLTALAWGVLLGWYITLMAMTYATLEAKKQLNYVNCTVESLKAFMSKRNAAAVLVGLSLIAGLFSIPFGLFSSTLGGVVQGIVFAAAAAYGLLALSSKEGYVDFGFYDAINRASPNAGLFLYAVVLVRVLPWGVGAALQFLGIPLAVIIICLYGQAKPLPVKPAPQPVRKQQV